MKGVGLRLYLSSFRIGRHGERLVGMAKGRKAAIIMNACDGHSAEGRAERLEGEMQALSELGFEPRELDLRDFFDDADTTRLEEALAEFDLVWVRGGNVFVLFRAMKQSGLGPVLRRLLERDAFVYGGYSAGIDVLAGDIKGVELVDDPNEVPAGYADDIVWDGLAVLPFAVAPHYKSDHPESAAIDDLVAHYIDNHIGFVALRDGEVIVQEGEGPLEVLG